MCTINIQVNVGRLRRFLEGVDTTPLQSPLTPSYLLFFYWANLFNNFSACVIENKKGRVFYISIRTFILFVHVKLSVIFISVYVE